LARQTIRPLTGDARATYAAIVIADQHPSFLIDFSTKEVQKIATTSIAANPAALNRIVGRNVLGPPRVPSIKSCSHVEIPNALEVGLIIISAARRRSEEGNGSSIAIARDCGVEQTVVDTQLRTDVRIVHPRLTFVSRNGDTRMTIGGLISKIHRVVRPDRNRWISIGLSSGLR